MHEIENAYNTWILSHVSMDQNVLEDVQNSLPKEPIDNKSEYEKLPQNRQKNCDAWTFLYNGVLFTR